MEFHQAESLIHWRAPSGRNKKLKKMGSRCGQPGALPRATMADAFSVATSSNLWKSALLIFPILGICRRGPVRRVVSRKSDAQSSASPLNLRSEFLRKPPSSTSNLWKCPAPEFPTLGKNRARHRAGVDWPVRGGAVCSAAPRAITARAITDRPNTCCPSVDTLAVN